MKHLILLLALIAGSVQSKLFSQDTTFKNGYALKGTDTIFCKVKFCEDCAGFHKHSVTLFIEGDEISFHAGNTITGYGVFDNGNEYHYGSVEIEMRQGNQVHSQHIFLKKSVAGAIDFYEHSFIIRTTKRTILNGETQRGEVTTRQDNTKYYIAKTDFSSPELSKPVLFESFRKKELEKYIKDNIILSERTEKRFSVNELVAIIKEYNQWHKEKKNFQAKKQAD